LSATECTSCEKYRAELDAARRRIGELEAELETVRAQLREVVKHDALQEQDLDRLREAYERIKPNCPERVPGNEAQLAFERVLETFGDAIAANDGSKGDIASSTEVLPSETPPSPPNNKGDKAKRRHRHGRRRLDLTNLPVESIVIDPPEVTAAGGKGFLRIGQEVSERLAFRPACYFRLRLVRGKWVAAPGTKPEVDGASSIREDVATSDTSTPAVKTGCVDADDAKSVLAAPLPEGVWPTVMADPSAVAQIIVSKYDDVLPLHRQERISVRLGFALPRSTQCGWLTFAYGFVYRVVEAMLDEARRTAFCIATDATGAPVRVKGGSVKWHVFVLIADRDHVIFRYADEHSGATVRAFLSGFHGYLLADAAPIYDVLYREEGMIEIACWFHCRRYFWKALETERDRAMEALSMIAKLFEAERACRDLPMPERTAERARRCEPILRLFDDWVEQHRGKADPRGRLATAIGYYQNQRTALRRFLDDGRLSLDNGVSERALRNLVLGRHNWGSFANETGLEWYTVFRSLIASCALHELNAQEYLEQLLRLAPHWPVTRMLELAPKYWAKTIAGLDARHRAILARPWEPAGAVTAAVAEILRAA
jgi:transposase